MTLYDLAGQAEYHSSHSAIMETVMQQSPATFINVIDLSKTDDEITQQLHYWFDSATSKTTSKSSLIIVGSHADLLNKKRKLESKSALITNLVQMRAKRQEFMGLVNVDCRKIDTASTREFISLLRKSQEAIAARAPSMSYYCHLLYAFLQESKVSACTLLLISLLDHFSQKSTRKEQHSLRLKFLSELLTALNDKGMNYFSKINTS